MLRPTLSTPYDSVKKIDYTVNDTFGPNAIKGIGKVLGEIPKSGADEHLLCFATKFSL